MNKETMSASNIAKNRIKTARLSPQPGEIAEIRTRLTLFKFCKYLGKPGSVAGLNLTKLVINAILPINHHVYVYSLQEELQHPN